MTKIYMKDIKYICNCIQSLSYEYIKENEKGCYNHDIITWYNIKPYTCKEVYFLFKDGTKKVITADNKISMYIRLLGYYKEGLYSWHDIYKNDPYKTKKEKHRMNKCFYRLNKFEAIIND